MHVYVYFLYMLLFLRVYTWAFKWRINLASGSTRDLDGTWSPIEGAFFCSGFVYCRWFRTLCPAAAPRFCAEGRCVAHALPIAYVALISISQAGVLTWKGPGLSTKSVPTVCAPGECIETPKPQNSTGHIFTEHPQTSITKKRRAELVRSSHSEAMICRSLYRQPSQICTCTHAYNTPKRHTYNHSPNQNDKNAAPLKLEIVLPAA